VAELPEVEEAVVAEAVVAEAEVAEAEVAEPEEGWYTWKELIAQYDSLKEPVYIFEQEWRGRGRESEKRERERERASERRREEGEGYLGYSAQRTGMIQSTPLNWTQRQPSHRRTCCPILFVGFGRKNSDNCFLIVINYINFIMYFEISNLKYNMK
jgi:hypothetical protein